MFKNPYREKNYQVCTLQYTTFSPIIYKNFKYNNCIYNWFFLYKNVRNFEGISNDKKEIP